MKRIIVSGKVTMNKFFDTALGKSVQTFLWTFAAYALALLGTDLAKVHWSGSALALGIPGLINLALYTAKVFVDKEVPNFPNSTPMVLVPANNQPEPTVVTPTVTPAPVTKIEVNQVS